MIAHPRRECRGAQNGLQTVDEVRWKTGRCCFAIVKALQQQRDDQILQCWSWNAHADTAKLSKGGKARSQSRRPGSDRTQHGDEVLLSDPHRLTRILDKSTARCAPEHFRLITAFLLVDEYCDPRRVVTDRQRGARIDRSSDRSSLGLPVVLRTLEF